MVTAFAGGDSPRRARVHLQLMPVTGLFRTNPSPRQGRAALLGSPPDRSGCRWSTPPEERAAAPPTSPTRESPSLSHPHPELTAPPPLADGGLRIVALGGLGEIGRNMTVFEYDGRLLVVDCGVLFPEDEQPGVDLILPDFT